MQDFMTEQYNFHARYVIYLALMVLVHITSPCNETQTSRLENDKLSSRRQYQNRFRKWGVRKNLNWEKREGILRCIEAGEDAFDGRKGLRNLKRRLQRHILNEAKQNNAEVQGASESGPCLEEDEGNGLQVSTSSSLGYLSSAIASIGEESVSSDSLQLPNLQLSPKDTLHVDPLTGRTLRPCFGIEVVDDFVGTGNWNLHGNLPSTYPTSLSISPPLPRDPTALDLCRLLKCVQDFSDSRLRSPYKDLNPSPNLETFWLNVHNCIYLYKLNDIERAGPLLKELCLVSSEIMLNLSVKSIREILTTFAPVNFRRNPEVRTKLLGHFTKMAEETFGHDNSITVICKELQKDEGSRNSTETALRCMLGSMHLARSPAAFDTERAIITILRRDKSFDDAVRMAENLVRSIDASAKPKSEEIRNAAKELVHVYMDIGRFDDAKVFCMTRVGKAVARDGLVGHEYHDRRTVSALEDLAKIEEELGALGLSATWLGHAADLARVIQGPSIAMTHILDKLVRALRLCGRYNDAEVTIRYYAPYVWRQGMDVTKN